MESATTSNFSIQVSERTDIGSSGSKRYRAQGFLPATAYHRSDAPVSVMVPYKEFSLLAGRARRSQVFTLQSAIPALNGKSAIVREVQRDYVKGGLLHVDFQTFREDEEVSVQVPVKIVGEAPGVKIQKGILTIVTHEVTVRCLAKDIPPVLEVPISGLELGQSIHVADLSLPTGVSVVDDEEETIVSVVASRAEEEGGAAAAAGTAAAGADAGKSAAPAAGAAAAKAPAAKAPAKK